MLKVFILCLVFAVALGTPNFEEDLGHSSEEFGNEIDNKSVKFVPLHLDTVRRYTAGNRVSGE